MGQVNAKEYKQIADWIKELKLFRKYASDDLIIKRCEETGLNKTTAIEHAIKYYLEQYEKTKRI